MRSLVMTPNEEPMTEDGGLRALAANHQMPDSARPNVTLGEIRAALASEARATATPSSLPAASTTIPRSHTNGTPGTADPRSTGTGQPSSPPAADTSDIGGGSRSSQVPLTPDGAGSASSSYLSVSGRYTETRATATPGLREALSDAVKRAGVYEIADAMVWAILDGTFADSSEDQVRHAVYELVGRAALDAATPGLREAAERLIADWDGLRSGLWRALKADVAALRAALSASGETEPDL